MDVKALLVENEKNRLVAQFLFANIRLQNTNSMTCSKGRTTRTELVCLTLPFNYSTREIYAGVEWVCYSHVHFVLDMGNSGTRGDAKYRSRTKQVVVLSRDATLRCPPRRRANGPIRLDCARDVLTTFPPLGVSQSGAVESNWFDQRGGQYEISRADQRRYTQR